MKASLLLSAAALGLSLLASPVVAAPTVDALPPIISSRTSLPSRLPKADLHAEQKAIDKNGELPPGVEQKGGMALNANETISALQARGGLPVAPASTVNDLVHYTYLAANAYCRSVVPGGKWDCAHCQPTIPDGKLVTTFTSLLYDTNGYIIRSDEKKQIDLAFRGTNSFRNFVADFDFLSITYPPVKGAKVHGGFYKAYLEVAEKVITNMRKQLDEYPDYKVVVTGHSLGGAFAVLGAMDLYQRDARFTKSNMKIYTYGGPRVGNPDFAYYVTGTGIDLFRTVNNRDIVPHLPPQSFGFLHPGVEYWINGGKDDVKICDKTLETSLCSNSIVPFTHLVDHLAYFDINAGLCL
ncbi:hypothetical protein EC973_005420 [Apophysomyces ossiformis]|uniref:Fungal lipase-type domain-containing protein n=1 Tax=Apophysomyces ossiformis TaxID=679940 RepID=A0A8H7EK50_9FUNG|nr:hypothetical protein EC973_005420 [Apophysomyces ossiformis]